MISPEPPTFDGWQVWCDTCVGHQSVNCTKERDQSSGEIYEYTCTECAAIILHIRRATPDEREKREPVASVN